MEKSEFLNRLRTLFNIDGDEMDELSEQQQLRFVDDPARYLIRANEKHSDAIWREIEKRQHQRKAA